MVFNTVSPWCLTLSVHTVAWLLGEPSGRGREKPAGRKKKSEQGGEEAHDRLPQTDEKRPMGVVVDIGGGDALGQIALEHLAHAPRQWCVDKEGIGLEVVLEASEVDVRGAAGGNDVVAYHHLGMDESVGIEIHLDTGGNGLADVGAARPIDKDGIGAARQDHLHVYTGQHGGAHGKPDRLGGQEVRGLDVDVATRLEQDAHIALHDLRPLVGGVAGDDLRQTVVGDGGVGGRIVNAVGDERPVHEIPVDEKCLLNAVDRSALDAQVGVAPLAPASQRGQSLAHTLDITQGDIHAADEARLAVDDAYLAVVAVVDLAGERREMHGDERTDHDTGTAHALEEASAHPPASHIVIDDPHLDALARLVDEHVGQQVSQGIVGKDVDRQMNVLPRTADGLEQGEVKGVTVGKDVDAVVLERQRAPLVGQLPYERLAFGRQMQGGLFDKAEHRTLGEQVEALTADDALLAGVAAEEYVEDDAAKRHEDQHKEPCHRLLGLTVVEQDRHHRTENQHDIEQQQYPVYIYHHTAFTGLASSSSRPAHTVGKPCGTRQDASGGIASSMFWR